MAPTVNRIWVNQDANRHADDATDLSHTGKFSKQTNTYEEEKKSHVRTSTLWASKRPKRTLVTL